MNPWHQVSLHRLLGRMYPGQRPAWSWVLGEYRGKRMVGVRSHTGRKIQVSLGSGKCRVRLWGER
jgi:hypothetical protein